MQEESGKRRLSVCGCMAYGAAGIVMNERLQVIPVGNEPGVFAGIYGGCREEHNASLL